LTSGQGRLVGTNFNDKGRLRGALLLGRFASFSRTPQGRLESFLLRREKRRNEHLPIPVVLHQCIQEEDDDGNGKA
jgi:hypothetical protein